MNKVVSEGVFVSLEEWVLDGDAESKGTFWEEGLGTGLDRVSVYFTQWERLKDPVTHGPEQ